MPTLETIGGRVFKPMTMTYSYTIPLISEADQGLQLNLMVLMSF